MLVTLVMIAGAVVGLTQVASAATPGIQASILLNNNETQGGIPVVNEGETLKLRVQYDTNVGAGTEVTFALSDNVTLAGVPAANTAIESVTKSGNQVTIKFRDPWPAAVNQGVFDLSFSVNSVDESKIDQIVWTINGEPTSFDVVIRNAGDNFANVTDTSSKSVSPTNLDSYVTVTGGVVTLKSEITSQELTYTLSLGSPTARNGFVISDALPAGLGYVADSFNATLTTWDANGLNQTTNPFTFSPTISGTPETFTATVNVPAQSVLNATYKVKVTDKAAIEALLQTQYNALGGGTGNFQVNRTNTANFGGTNRTATVRFRGNVPGVNVGNAFSKTSDWTTKVVETDEIDALTPSADITYTFKADLRQWVGTPNFTLDRNVVISDDLNTNGHWNTTDPQFVVGSGITLTSAGTCPATVAEFAADGYVGQYCVNGQTLMINVGKDNSLNATIAVKARIDSVDGLPDGNANATNVKDAVVYEFPNTANFYYRSGSPHSSSKDVNLVVLPDDSEGLNDSSVFNKTGTPSATAVDPGGTIRVDYRFDLTAGKGVDVRTSKLVDYVDPAIFDLGDDADDPIVDSISGTYDGQTLNASHFDLSIDTDDNLVIELSAAGKAIVDARGADKAYRVNVTLETRPFVGKETKTITNRATLFGSDDKPRYWSETSFEATSYGDEAEVRKRVFDNAVEDWAESAGALMDGEGNLVQDTWVYRVQFIPHGTYDKVAIVPVVDHLPDAVDFLGFVDASDTSGESPAAGPVAIGGNLEAVYDAVAHTVTIRQQGSSKLDAKNAPFATYFAVKVTDASDSIVNAIGSTSATIDPLPSVSVGDYVWFDSNRDGRQDKGEPGIPGVVLTIVGPDGEPVVDVHGNPVGPRKTDANGLYSFDDLPALSGDGVYKVCIDREASAEALKGYTPTKSGVGDREGDSSDWCASTEPGDLHNDGDRDPTLDFGFVVKTYAVGDYVWVDTNRNGIQDAGEKPLPGVKVELFNASGKSVGSTTTDANGRYVFDNLPAGTYRVRFTLTAEQAAIYEFTSAQSGSNSAVDSDASPSDGWTRSFVLDDSNKSLTGDYEYREISASEGVDPTWDAGVVFKDEVDTGPATDGRDVGAGGAGQGDKLAWTGTNSLMMVVLSLLTIWLGWVFTRIGRYGRREI